MSRCYKAHETKSFHLVKLLMTQIFGFSSVTCLPYITAPSAAAEPGGSRVHAGCCTDAQTGLMQMPRHDSLGGI
jgi:hypothetical protein